MRRDSRRAVRLAVLAALGLSLPASAAFPVGVGVVSLSGPSAIFSAPKFTAGGAAAFSISAAPSANLAAFAASASVFLAPAAIVPGPVALAAASSAETPRPSGQPAQDALRSGAASGGGAGVDYDGASGKARRADPPDAASDGSGPRGFVKNADGVWVAGRVAEQSLWNESLAGELSRRGIDLTDVMNVMGDSYDEVRAKLAHVERIVADRQIVASNVHLAGTRHWTDAIMVDSQKNNIAVHLYRVYYHPAPGNSASEIAEGIRRVDKDLDEMIREFRANGHSERQLGMRFAAIELGFDTQGYQEIEDHLRRRERDIRAAYGGRFHFSYVTEPKLASARIRAEYNRYVEKHADQPEGLSGIIDGVTYSRLVGMGHELTSHKKRLSLGFKITQAGRDFIGKKVLPDGSVVDGYITEFDAVTERAEDAHKPSKERDVILWEDKSARVWMPLDEVMERTFLYKLRIYRDNRAVIEESLGGAPLKVVFSVDVGGLNRKAAKQGLLVWQDLEQQALMHHLQRVAPKLSRQYGFPVSFVFVNSHPHEDMDLFYQELGDEAQWRRPYDSGRKKDRKQDPRSPRRGNRHKKRFTRGFRGRF